MFKILKYASLIFALAIVTENLSQIYVDSVSAPTDQNNKEMYDEKSENEIKEFLEDFSNVSYSPNIDVSICTIISLYKSLIPNVKDIPPERIALV